MYICIKNQEIIKKCLYKQASPDGCSHLQVVSLMDDPLSKDVLQSSVKNLATSSPQGHPDDNACHNT